MVGRLKTKTRKRENEKTRGRKITDFSDFQKFLRICLIVLSFLVAFIVNASEEGKLVEIELENEDKITITKYSPGSRPIETSIFGPGFFYYSTGVKPKNAEEYMYMPVPVGTSLFIYKNKTLIKTETGPTVLYYKLGEEKAISSTNSHQLQLPEGYQDAIEKATDIGSISNEYLGKLSKRLDWIDDFDGFEENDESVLPQTAGDKTHRLVTGMSVTLAPQTISAYKFGTSAGKVQMSLLNGKGEPIKEPISAAVLKFDQTLQVATDEGKQINWNVSSPGNYFLLVWNEHTQASTIWITTSHTSTSQTTYRGRQVDFGDIINQKFDSLYSLYNIYNINIPQQGNLGVHFNEKNFRAQLRSEKVVFEKPPFKISTLGPYQLKVDMLTGLNITNRRKYAFEMSLKFNPEVIIWKTKKVDELDGPPF